MACKQNKGKERGNRKRIKAEQTNAAQTDSAQNAVNEILQNI
jgi:hypothetical protein